MRKRALAIPFLCCASLAYAGTADPSGVAGPALFLWAITHPLSTIEAMSKAPAERRRREALVLAKTQCEAEVSLLPESFDVESFIDEGAGLYGNLIYELLIERNVKAIFVKPQPRQDGKALRFGYADGQYIGGFSLPPWPTPQPVGTTYIKLELARKGEGRCLPEKWAPLYTREKYDRPPGLPDICLAYSFTDSPDSRYAIKYAPTNKVVDQQFGMWSLVDLVANKPVASLTTTDAPLNTRSGGDCRAPHTVLARRIKPSSSQRNPFAVRFSVVIASPQITDLSAAQDSLPVVQATVERTPYLRGEWESLSNDAGLRASWNDAVNEARQSEWGYFQRGNVGYSLSPDRKIHAGAHGAGRILDWKSGTLIGLQLVETGTHIPGSLDMAVSANERGFLVFPSDWKTEKLRVLAKYAVDGKLEWAVQIAGVADEGCWFGPRTAQVTNTEIVLRQPSCNNKDGKVWRINKKDIPFYKNADSTQKNRRDRHPVAQAGNT